MFGKILIANRGEIACRIIGTARRLGIATVAVYSDADAQARHVALADEALPIGPAPARASYLNIEAILKAAQESGSQAVHPGYGFLSENAGLAEACAAADIAFIGPPAVAIRAMGSKAAARALMREAGVPIVPGYDAADQDPARLLAAAEQIGFPVLIKASAGGGGRGMRVVEQADAFAAALAAAMREAEGAFGDGRVLLERYLSAPRHIEIQVFADRHGNFVHLFERDCSIQRRHQKVVEEAPAPDLAEETRAAMAEAALAATRAVGYVGAGTVEFVVADGRFHFIEMNTRLQVEHRVTEAITGLDLVEWQLRVAAGERLPLAQKDVVRHGHAIEVRLYAEAPERNFLPQTGRIAGLCLPSPDHALSDSGVRPGDTVTPFYDPMIAKLVVHGDDRAMAVARLKRALAETAVLGLSTNLAFLARVAAHPAFAAGAIDTGFIERHRAALLPAPCPAPAAALAAAALVRLAARAEEARRQAAGDWFSPWTGSVGWRLGGERGVQDVVFRDGVQERMIAAMAEGESWRLDLGERTALASGTRGPEGGFHLVLDGAVRRLIVLDSGADLAVFLNGESWRLSEIDPLAPPSGLAAAAGRLSAPMPGRVTRLLVGPGSRVRRGAPLIVIEAMKMEHTVAAPADGIVEAVRFAVGDLVEEGAELIALAATPQG
ncbi:MAG: acetyl/propionyl/methylcrotonyl-CoA carboxylase subunit alpha [Stellaceae bacterium]